MQCLQVYYGVWQHTDVAVKRFLEQELCPKMKAVRGSALDRCTEVDSSAQQHAVHPPCLFQRWAGQREHLAALGHASPAGWAQGAPLTSSALA